MINEELERAIEYEDFKRDKLKDDIHYLYEENKELKERIDKSIEYIKEHTLIDYYGMPCFNNTNNINELLEILGGKENE